MDYNLLTIWYTFSAFMVITMTSFITLSSQEAITTEEQFIQTTALIRTINTSKSDSSSGTGFFYADNSIFPNSVFLVTNKHVIDNRNIGQLYFNQIDVNGNIYGNKAIVTIDNFESRWNLHPNPAVDLCYLDITEIINFYEAKGIRLFTRKISNELLPADSIWASLNVYEDIIMIGYPAGLFDQVNNIPILRTGVTATPPRLDYNGKREFLIDIAAFPGSSGSPVFLKRTPYGVRDSGNGVSIGFFPEYYFVGVLYAGPTYNQELKSLSGNNISELFEKEKLALRLMINLGIVIKSTEVNYMINYYKK